jgi:flagellar biosynthesis/type III secretory pathway chaperone
MDIDQRLDKLTERHEALTQTVELTARMQQKNEVLIAHLIESVGSLARIAHAHENRITGLEDGRQ